MTNNRKRKNCFATWYQKLGGDMAATNKIEAKPEPVPLFQTNLKRIGKELNYQFNMPNR